MKQYIFDSHAQYVKAQVSVTRRKMAAGVKEIVNDDYVKRIRSAYNGISQDFVLPSFRGLCQGVRTGHEVDMFNEHFGGTWIGTEIVPELCDGVKVVCADFTLKKSEWESTFSAIYSNSLDHARFPEEALAIWATYLMPGGVLMIHWDAYSNRLGRRANRADCFAANRDEYSMMLSQFGAVSRVDFKRKSIFFVRKV